MHTYISMEDTCSAYNSEPTWHQWCWMPEIVLDPIYMIAGDCVGSHIYDCQRLCWIAYIYDCRRLCWIIYIVLFMPDLKKMSSSALLGHLLSFDEIFHHTFGITEAVLQWYSVQSLHQSLDGHGFVGMNFCTPVFTSNCAGITATTMCGTTGCFT